MFVLILPVTLLAFKKKNNPSYLDLAPFPAKAYQNNGKYYKCAGTGKSTDMNIAHDKALVDAKKRLIDAILDSYNDNFENGKGMLQNIDLDGLKVVDEDNRQSSGHINICWIIIQVDRNAIKASVVKNFEKMDIDNIGGLNTFLKKFDKEMAYLKNDAY